MSTIVESNKRLKPSLIDCLLDENPDSQVDSDSHYSNVLNKHRESVRSDLESLLNTRICHVEPLKELSYLRDSLLNYGLPDISTVNLESTRHVNEFCHQIEETIRIYEPRIRDVNVSAYSKFDNTEKFFRFRVKAVLIASPASEMIIFDSTLDPVTRNVRVIENQL